MPRAPELSASRAQRGRYLGARGTLPRVVTVATRLTGLDPFKLFAKMATPGELFSEEILSCLDQEELKLATSQSSNAPQRYVRVEWAEPFSAKRGGRRGSAVAFAYRFLLPAGG